MADIDAVVTGVGLLIKSSLIIALDGFLAVSDVRKRNQHITALAIDAFMLLGAALLITGGVTSGIGLIIGGGVTASVAGLCRLLFFYCIEKPDLDAFSPSYLAQRA